MAAGRRAPEHPVPTAAAVAATRTTTRPRTLLRGIQAFQQVAHDLGVFRTQVQGAAQEIPGLVLATEFEQHLTQVGQDGPVGGPAHGDGSTQPVLRLLQVAQAVVNPAQRIEIRGAVGSLLDRDLDEFQGPVQVLVAVGQQVAEIVGGVGVGGVLLEQALEGDDGLLDGTRPFQRRGPGEGQSPGIGEAFHRDGRGVDHGFPPFQGLVGLERHGHGRERLAGDDAVQLLGPGGVTGAQAEFAFQRHGRGTDGFGKARLETEQCGDAFGPALGPAEALGQEAEHFGRHGTGFGDPCEPLAGGAGPVGDQFDAGAGETHPGGDGDGDVLVNDLPRAVQKLAGGVDVAPSPVGLGPGRGEQQIRVLRIVAEQAAELRRGLGEATLVGQDQRLEGVRAGGVRRLGQDPAHDGQCFVPFPAVGQQGSGAQQGVQLVVGRVPQQGPSGLDHAAAGDGHVDQTLTTAAENVRAGCEDVGRVRQPAQLLEEASVIRRQLRSAAAGGPQIGDDALGLGRSAETVQNPRLGGLQARVIGPLFHRGLEGREGLRRHVGALEGDVGEGHGVDPAPVPIQILLVAKQVHHPIGESNLLQQGRERDSDLRHVGGLVHGALVGCGGLAHAAGRLEPTRLEEGPHPIREGLVVRRRIGVVIGAGRHRGGDEAESDEEKPCHSVHYPSIRCVSERWRTRCYNPRSMADASDHTSLFTETTFASLELPDSLQRALHDLGFEYLTRVQDGVLPLSLEGRDVVAQAQTGSGKTAAYLLTIFQRLLTVERTSPEDTPRALIIAPTRELAVQIASDADKLAAHTDLVTHVVFGGLDYAKQRSELRAGVDLLIGTPGRLIDYNKQGVYSLRQTEMVVVDECDRLFDMGFADDLRWILRRLPAPEKRQSMMFTATLSQRVTTLGWRQMHDPAEVIVSRDALTPDTIRQELYHVAAREKLSLLLGLLAREGGERTMVFVNTRHGARHLVAELQRHGYKARGLTGNVVQTKRLKVLDQFRDGELPILVATDVASRGLHIDGVSHVINYDLPQDAEDYVHRIGRTARVGASGSALSLACEDYVYSLDAIQKYVGYEIPVEFAPEELFAALKPRGEESSRDRDSSRRPRGRRPKARADGPPPGAAQESAPPAARKRRRRRRRKPSGGSTGGQGDDGSS
jgi:ATP-dependent RNA helicase RhlB